MILDYFQDWQKFTASFYQLTETKDANGRVVKGETLLGTETVAKWKDNVQETNVNDKFVGQESGRLALPPVSYTIDTTCHFKIDGVKYMVVGVDNIAGFGEVLIISYRRDVVG